MDGPADWMGRRQSIGPMWRIWPWLTRTSRVALPPTSARNTHRGARWFNRLPRNTGDVHPAARLALRSSALSPAAAGQEAASPAPTAARPERAGGLWASARVRAAPRSARGRASLTCEPAEARPAAWCPAWAFPRARRADQRRPGPGPAAGQERREGRAGPRARGPAAASASRCPRSTRSMQPGPSGPVARSRLSTKLAAGS